MAWTLARMVEASEDLREACRGRFTEEGWLLAHAFLFCTDEGKDVIVLVPPWPYEFDDRGRSMYSKVLRKMAQATDAVGIIFVSEMWGLKEPLNEAEGNKWIGRLHEHPDRTECLWFTLETLEKQESTFVWVAPIQRDAAGKPSLEPWEHRTVAGAGRFIGILRRNVD